MNLRVLKFALKMGIAQAHVIAVIVQEIVIVLYNYICNYCAPNDWKNQFNENLWRPRKLWIGNKKYCYFWFWFYICNLIKFGILFGLSFDFVIKFNSYVKDTYYTIALYEFLLIFCLWIMRLIFQSIYSCGKPYHPLQDYAPEITEILNELLGKNLGQIVSQYLPLYYKEVCPNYLRLESHYKK